MQIHLCFTHHDIKICISFLKYHVSISFQDLPAWLCDWPFESGLPKLKVHPCTLPPHGSICGAERDAEGGRAAMPLPRPPGRLIVASGLSLLPDSLCLLLLSLLCAVTTPYASFLLSFTSASLPT